MAYIGNQPALQYITFAKQTFTADGSTVAFTLDNSVANENELEVFVNNVRQEPGSGKAYTASGTTLTMSEAPNTGDDFYCIYQGKATQTVTPGASTVTNAMLSGSIDLTTKVTGVLPVANSQVMTPAFSVGLSGNQTIGDAAYTKLQFNLEFFDTDSAFDSSTNYNFTVPSGKAGKYFISASARNTTATDFDSYYLRIQKNNAEWLFSSIRSEFRETITIADVIDLSVGDTLHCEVYNGSGGNLDISGSSDKPSGTHFSGFKLLG